MIITFILIAYDRYCLINSYSRRHAFNHAHTGLKIYVSTGVCIFLFMLHVYNHYDKRKFVKKNVLQCIHISKDTKIAKFFTRQIQLLSLFSISHLRRSRVWIARYTNDDTTWCIVLTSYVKFTHYDFVHHIHYIDGINIESQ